MMAQLMDILSSIGAVDQVVIYLHIVFAECLALKSFLDKIFYVIWFSIENDLTIFDLAGPELFDERWTSPVRLALPGLNSSLYDKKASAVRVYHFP